MKGRTQKTCVLASLLVSLMSSISTADPLHPFGDEGAWRHEYSGWQFTKRVGDFTRVQAPYTIDGNNDVGVQYERTAAEPRIAAVVEVYLADSAATDAKLPGAKTSAALKVGATARVQPERPFKVAAGNPVRGTKVTYETPAGTRTHLYFFDAGRWTIKVLGSTPAARDDKALDAFVRALPWDSLGDPTARH